MIQLPQNEWRRAEVLASWVELSALAEDNGFVSRGSVLNCFNDSMLFVDKLSSGDQRDSSNEGTAAAMVADVWRTLYKRKRLVGDSWPFDLDDNSLTRKEGKKLLEAVVAYTTMLLIEAAASGWYENLKITKSDIVRTHFEVIVAYSLASISGGRTTRFGAPFPAGWPRGFPARVKHLAEYFGLRADEQKIGILASTHQQDGSLDIVARLKFGDEEAANAYLLVQCATGKTWVKEKLGEPMMTLWKEFVAWNGPHFKVIAVPFVVREDNELYRASVLHDYAIILDRLRIAAGAPDNKIDQPFRELLISWCAKKFILLPAKAA